MVRRQTSARGHGQQEYVRQVPLTKEQCSRFTRANGAVPHRALMRPPRPLTRPRANGAVPRRAASNALPGSAARDCPVERTSAGSRQTECRGLTPARRHRGAARAARSAVTAAQPHAPQSISDLPAPDGHHPSTDNWGRPTGLCSKSRMPR